MTLSNNNYTLGIDFGTCFSFAATKTGNNMLLLCNDAIGIPTQYYLDDSGEEKVGHDVILYQIKNIDNHVDNIKADILAGGKEYPFGKTSADVCAEILKDIVSKAERELNRNCLDSNIKFESAVITIPAKMTQNSQKIIETAAINAGLKNVKFLHEPVAAALGYTDNFANNNSKFNYILVYDFGGGTFDVSLLKYSGVENPKFIDSDGITKNTGGKKIDELLAKKLIDGNSDFKSIINTATNNKDYLEFLKKVNSMKERLTSCNYAYESLLLNGKLLQLDLSRPNLEETIEDIVDGTIKCTTDFLKSIDKKRKLKIFNGDSLSDDVVVVMVGGSSRIPIILDRLKNKLKTENIRIHEPHRAIAHGAALYANDIFNTDSGSSSDIKGYDNIRLNKKESSLITPISQYSYGVLVVDGLFRRREVVQNVILKKTPLPTNHKNWYEAFLNYFEDGLEQITLQFYENDFDEERVPLKMIENKNPTFKLTIACNNGLINVGDRVQYRLWLDAGNILHAEAKIVRNGKELSATPEITINHHK